MAVSSVHRKRMALRPSTCQGSPADGRSPSPLPHLRGSGWLSQPETGTAVDHNGTRRRTDPNNCIRGTTLTETICPESRGKLTRELPSNQVSNKSPPTTADASGHRRTVRPRSDVSRPWQTASRVGFGTKRPPIQIRPPRLTSRAWPMVALLARRANADQQRAGKPVSGACPAAEQQTEPRIECLSSSFPGNRGDRAGHRGRRRQGSAISAVHRNRGVPCRISHRRCGDPATEPPPGNPSPGFDTSGYSAAPKCSNLGTRVDECNEY
jgi:hypothetical protein